jgi:hypothetical protein
VRLPDPVPVEQNWVRFCAGVGTRWRQPWVPGQDRSATPTDDDPETRRPRGQGPVRRRRSRVEPIEPSVAATILLAMGGFVALLLLRIL